MRDAARPDPVRFDVSELEAQRRRGHPHLRFEGALEAAFRKHYCRFMRQHAIAAMVAALCLILLGLLINITVAQPPAPVQQGFVLVFGVLLPSGLVAALVYMARARDALLMPYIAAVMVCAAFASTLWLTVLYARHGLEYPYATLYFILTFNFLLISLRYFQAQALAWAGALALLTTECWWLKSSSGDIALSLYNYVGVGALVSTAGYLQEYVVRTHFLESGIRRHQALHDALTGLLNRHGLDTEGRRVWRQAQRDQRPLGVAVFDIDWFKPYNDVYGHPAGDVCLTRVAELLRARCTRRPLDLAARLGGEEFAVVWYDVNLADAAVLAERFRAAVEAEAMPHPDAACGHVTVSGGVVAMAADDPSGIDHALVQADAALYAAKNAGRNRIIRVCPELTSESGGPVDPLAAS